MRVAVTVRVGVVGVMRMVVCVGIREWTRPPRQYDVTVGPTVRMAMDMLSMPMKDSTRTGHACLTLARHERQTTRPGNGAMRRVGPIGGPRASGL